MAICTRLTIEAADRYPLAARLWSCADEYDRARMVAFINGGAGINGTYYDRFASFMADAGYPTLVYDYRGIGESRRGSLRGFQASVEEWGSKDCAAIIDWVAKRFPSAKRLAIGHSVGGFLTGFAANGHMIDRMVLVNAHTGYWGEYAPRTRIAMYLLWHLFMPALTRIVGYFPGRRLHLLEDLPAGVAYQWASRTKPDFWWNLALSDGSPDREFIALLLGRFHSIRALTLALRVADDPFATTEATNRILSLFDSCRPVYIEISPAAAGAQTIGHFGFFHSRFQTSLWPKVTTWLHATPDEFGVGNDRHG